MVKPDHPTQPGVAFVEYQWTREECLRIAQGQDERAGRLEAKGFRGTALHCRNRAAYWRDKAASLPRD